MQNKGKISLPAFVACHKKVFIAVAVLLVVVISAITIPLVCIDFWCFDINFNESTSSVEITYTGVRKSINLVIYCHSNTGYGDMKVYIYDPVTLEKNESISIPIVTSDRYYFLTIWEDNNTISGIMLYDALYADGDFQEIWHGTLDYREQN